MESNWRFNVWNLGLNSRIFPFCARLLGITPDTYLIPGQAPPPGSHWFLRYSIFGDAWVIAGSTPDLAPGNFPYGNNVEPD